MSHSRAEVLDILGRAKRREITNAYGAKLLGISPAHFSRLKTGKSPVNPRGAPAMVKPVSPETPPVPAPAPSLVSAAPPVTPPRSFEELLRGPGGAAPSVTLTGTPVSNTDAVTKIVPGPTATPVPAPEPIDKDAAELGRKLILKLRTGFLKTLLRYYAGVDPNDPRVLEMLPETTAADIRSRVSMLDLVLRENEEKTQKIGRVFKGWPGMGLGVVLELFDVAGAVRIIASTPGLKMPVRAAPPEDDDTEGGAEPDQPLKTPPIVPPREAPRKFSIADSLAAARAAAGRAE